MRTEFENLGLFNQDCEGLVLKYFKNDEGFFLLQGRWFGEIYDSFILKTFNRNHCQLVQK